MATKAVAPKATKATKVTTGAIIDQLFAAREEKRRLEEQVKEVSATMAEIEAQLLERMDAEGLEKATGGKASTTISSSVVADVQDWEALWPYIAKNKLFHMVQRRVSDPAYRELLELGKKVPGVVPFTKRKVLLRSL